MSGKKRDTGEPMRLWVVVKQDGTPVVIADGETVSFTGEAAALRAAGAQHRVVEFIEVRQPPERSTPWGDGQFDHVQVGPGVTIALRITKDGRVKMLSPGGEIDVTDGSASLGTGLHEAGRRAAQVRVRREDRARKRAESKRTA